MCGRYELHTHPAALALAFGIPVPAGLEPRYNIAPTQDVPVIRQSSLGVRELAFVRWGLVPRSAKDPSIGARMINARAETLSKKRSFQMPLQRHRCLVPADGFYEWRKTASGGKQPFHIGMKDDSTFALAGLAERWLSPAGEVLDTCAIITTRANPSLSVMHDRMPAIIEPSQYERWLDASLTDIAELLRPYPSEAMRWYPVSTRVNAVRNDDARLIEPLAHHDLEPEVPDLLSETVQEAAPTATVPEQTELF